MQQCTEMSLRDVWPVLFTSFFANIFTDKIANNVGIKVQIIDNVQNCSQPPGADN